MVGGGFAGTGPATGRADNEVERRMIVSHVLGGLGNQMFQYAFGRYLADRLDQPFYLDLRHFADYDLHAYQLDYFPHRGLPLPSELADRCPRAFSGWRVRAAALVPRPLRRRLRLVRERPFGFDPRYLRAAPNSYLWGYWQSERFFPGHRERILRDFAFDESRLSAATRRVAEQIGRRPSVFLHVRRGDYVTDPAARRVYLQMDRDYYRQALTALQQQVPGLQAFVFTNDPAWCHEHLDLGTPLEIVDHNTAATCQEDLYLMSRCRFAIIANSTFSWWGAYLIQDPGAAVYCPSRWTYPETGRDDRHLAVDSWRRIEVTT